MPIISSFKNKMPNKNIFAFKVKINFILGLSTIIFLQCIPNAYSESKMAVLEPMIEGLEFPSNLVFLKDGNERIFVLEKDQGKIRLISDQSINVSFITTDSDNKIMIMDGLNGHIYRFNFSEKIEGDWKDFKELTYEMMLNSRRNNTIIFQTIREFTNSKRWKMTQPIVDVFRWARRLFQ